MATEYFLLFGIALISVGALSALVPVKNIRRTSYLLSLVGSLCFLALGLILTLIPPVSYQALSASSIFEYSLRGDALAGFFIITISLVSSSVFIFSLGFTSDSTYLGLSGFFTNILVVSLYAVVLSANLFTFLISWETMAIASYFLLTLEQNEKASRAALFYAVITHIGTAFIISLFFILYHETGRMDFEGMKTGIIAVPAVIKSIIFIFPLIGFGTKAGIVPLHTWIPRAYTVASPHIAALMSGLMVKMGIYGFLRISVDVLGQGPEWWGIPFPGGFNITQEQRVKIVDIQKKIDTIFGRSLRIRHVDAGSCNACEWECTALTNPIYDIQRFDIDFVASPRHADVLLVTGPVSRQMEHALKRTYISTPEPRLVVACGDCAIDGGI